MTRKHIRIFWADGDITETPINGTEAEIREYYEGKVFHVGRGEDDYLVECNRIEFLPEVAA
jgi:hypothetical protein